MKTGIEIIADERSRQISQEGWDAKNDDNQVAGELARAGAVYADAAVAVAGGTPPADVRDQILDEGCETPWPWDDAWLKVSADPIRNLAKAGALIAAEIDRLQRRMA